MVAAVDLVPSDMTLSFDWFIFALRVAFIFLVYFFLYQVARVTIRRTARCRSSAVTMIDVSRARTPIATTTHDIRSSPSATSR